MSFPEGFGLSGGREHLTPTPEQYENIVNGLANHEAKLVTMAIVASHPDRAFSSSDIYTDVNGAQGASPGWRQAEGTSFGYLAKSLAPIGCVAKLHLDTSAQPIEAYSATEFGKTTGLAASGALLDWSLRHENLSLQTILGTSQSRNNNRAPSMRLTLLQSILTAPDGVVSLVEMEEKYPHFDSRRARNSIRGGGTIFEYNSSHESAYDPTFRIESSEYSGLRPFSSLQPARQAIYQGVRLLSGRGIERSSIVELTSLIAAEVPKADVVEVRQLLMQAVGHRNRREYGELPGLIFEDRAISTGLGEGERTAIRIQAEHVEACKDLVKVFENLQSGRNALSYRNRARAIVASEELCALLMAKARSGSPRARALQRGTKAADEITRLLAAKSGQELFLEDIQKGLQENDIKLSRTTLRNALNQLALQGTIDSADRPSAIPGVERQAKTYRLKIDEES
jgi:hypothetical protein